MYSNRITIGRDPRNDVRIDEHWDTVSNRHGEISQENGELTFIDHSSNGTVINGQKIQNTSVRIYPGDTIRLANAFELEWNVIEHFFPELKRPTVTRNTRGECPKSTGRQTIQMNVEKKAKGRKTERFNNDPRQADISNHGYEDNANYGQANEFSQSEISKEIEKWNWGAFFCSWLWGAFNGIYWPLFIILIAGVPYIGQVCSLCLCVYLGLNGSKMAWRTGKYKTFERFKKSQRIWTIGGIIWFALNIWGYIYVLNYSLSIL